MSETPVEFRDKVNSSANEWADFIFAGMRGARRLEKKLIYARGRNSAETLVFKSVTIPLAFGVAFLRGMEAVNYGIAHHITQFTGGRKSPLSR
jgi:hypothetical protein